MFAVQVLDAGVCVWEGGGWGGVDGNVPMWVYINGSVEHRKSNTKTDNITSSKPGRLAAKHKTWGKGVEERRKGEGGGGGGG